MTDDLLPNIESLTWVSGVSLFTGEPFVTLFTNNKPLGQMSPTEARDTGLAALECAEASETDALVYKFFTDHEGDGRPDGNQGEAQQMAGYMISWMRKQREDKEK